MTTTSDLSHTISRATAQFQEEARNVGHTALKAARDQVIEPARQVANRVSDAAQHAFDETRHAWAKHTDGATILARENCDRAIAWARDNPLLTIGIAFAAGLLVASSSRSATK